jgi:hypothetical protein
LMRTFKSFRIKLPSGERYWTVIDGSYRPAQGVDDWLLHLRTGRGCAESTTESYAGALALFSIGVPRLDVTGLRLRANSAGSSTGCSTTTPTVHLVLYHPSSMVRAESTWCLPRCESTSGTPLLSARLTIRSTSLVRGADRSLPARRPTLATLGNCARHTVVGFQDQALGPVLAVVTLVVLADDEERVEDVFGLLTVQPVHMHKRSIEVGA